MKTPFLKLLAAVAMLAASLFVFADPALAADKIHLKDGRVIEGTIDKEDGGAIWFTIMVGSIKRTEIYTSDQIRRIERAEEMPAKDAAQPKGDKESSTTTTEDAPAAPTTDSNAARVVFVSLEEMVGPYLNADALKKSIEMVKDEDPQIVVLVINSGGGALAEVEPLSDYIHDEMKKHYRVVSWVRSAISAASMTAWNCEEIYMMREGNIGGTVAFVQTGPGQTKAASGRELEEILAGGEKLSKRGRRDPLIMRAMQVFMDLSADIDENGKVTWYEGRQGKYLVNPKERILTLNSQDALKFGVSKGTADTKDELLRLMGVNEWVEIGPEADEYQQQFRAAGQKFEAKANELFPKLNQAKANAGQGNADNRAEWAGRARRILAEIRSLVRQAPSLEKYNGLNREWFEAQEEEIRKLSNPNAN